MIKSYHLLSWDPMDDVQAFITSKNQFLVKYEDRIRGQGDEKFRKWAIEQNNEAIKG